jgi:hypothetical protein
MARTIRLDQIGDYCEGKLEQLLRSAVLQTDTLVKQESPVDLGRFRLSWAIGENSAPFQGVPPGNYRGQPVPPPRPIGYAGGQERLGNVYSIHNNLPYAEALARGTAGSGKRDVKRYNPTRTVTTWSTPGGGSSLQTDGPGWIEQIAKSMQAYVRTEADRIGRQS